MNLKRKIAFYMSLTCLIISWPVYGEDGSNNQEALNINAKGAILVEESSMRILWERDADLPLPMASTTKIMTCIVALENGNMEDIVVASKRAAAAPKVKLFLKPGERQTLEDLMYALMLQSSNDAAVAIAEHVGGSVEEFCEIMTQKAKELGAKATVFKTPNGLDAPGHVSTPYDLAIISKHAFENPEFLKIITTSARNIPSKPLEESRPHALVNKNNFLTSYPGANGIKTGYTGLAGHCFVGAAKRDDMQLFAVVLASGWGGVGRNQKYIDTARLMDYGFKNYKITPIKQAMDDAGALPVIKGEEEIVRLAYGKSLNLPLREDEKDKISITLNIPTEIQAPIKARQSIGIAEVFIDQRLVGTLPIITTTNVDEKTIKRSIQKAFKEWINLLTK